MTAVLGEVALVMVLSAIPWLYFAAKFRSRALLFQAELISWQSIAYAVAALANDGRMTILIKTMLEDQPDWYREIFEKSAQRLIESELEIRTAPDNDNENTDPDIT